MREIPRLLAALRMGRTPVAAVLVGAALFSLPGIASAAGHLVVPGDTLSGVAAANGLTTDALAAANGLSPADFIISGTTLSIPAPGTASAGGPGPAATSGGRLVVVGDTLSGIAAANGLSTAALAAANGLTPTSFVIAGTRLTIPAAGTASTPTAPAAAGSGHLVTPGETLSGIAAANGITTGALAAANGLAPTSFVIAGTRLTVPAAMSQTAVAQEQAGVGQVQAGVPNAPMPTTVRLTGAEIGQIAAQNGVASSLAQAVAWQESGFNNAVLSSANARGIMQIIPTTWQFIQSNLTPSPLDPESPVDNVRAGSLLLRHLLANAGGDPTTALAGYYQGANSVRRIGLLPETQRYVANVLALRDQFGG